MVKEMKKSFKNIPVNALEPPVDDVEFDYSDEEDEDADLIRLVEERLANDTGIRIPAEEVYRKLGITKEDWEAVGEVEIE